MKNQPFPASKPASDAIVAPQQQFTNQHLKNPLTSLNFHLCNAKQTAFKTGRQQIDKSSAHDAEPLFQCLTPALRRTTDENTKTAALARTPRRHPA
ncbi:MAG: hypothetical protein RBR77_08635 [Thauera sp.]|jgi:hypothetical protein|nr:hypothetical protein [Thauera sp.]